jgi:hypothetical protein
MIELMQNLVRLSGIEPTTLEERIMKHEEYDILTVEGKIPY